jgi:hypothetical protein
MLGKLESRVPKVIKMPLDIAIQDLKKYKREMPFNLYDLSSKQVNYLRRMLSIIEGMEIPERFTSE